MQTQDNTQQLNITPDVDLSTDALGQGVRAL